MVRSIYRAFVLCLVFAFVFAPSVRADSSYFEIPDGLVWLNTARPLKVSDLKGKFVLVYFWNYSGMGVQSVIDQSRDLQKKYPKELVVVGIHSGQALDDDGLNRKIVEAIRVYRISHPIAVDNRMETLKAFRFDRWPAVVLFAPDGSVLTSKAGERDLFYIFSRVIAKNLPRYSRIINEEVMEFDAAPKAEPVIQAFKVDVVPAAEANVLTNEIKDVAVDPNEPPSAEGVVAAHVIEPKEAVKKLTPKFFGEKIVIGREYSQKVGLIYLKFRLPTDAHLLETAQSYVRVFTDDGNVIAQGDIKDAAQTSILMDREIAANRINIEAMLYYCTQGNKSICRVKGVQFAVPLAKYPKQEDITIEHDIGGQEL